MNAMDHCDPALDCSQRACPGELPTDRKYTIGIDEAARYYGIGSKKLRQIISDNPMGDFYLEIGRHVLIKRRQFELYLDQASSL
jgi:excisionase family DNA binding protein